MESDLVLLELLPEELLFEVLDRAPEAVLAMKMTSKALKERVERYVSSARKRRLIEMMFIGSEHENASTTITMHVSIKRTDLFEMRLRLNGFDQSTISRYECDRNNTIYEMKLEAADDLDHKMLARLNTCMGGLPASTPDTSRRTIGNVYVGSSSEKHSLLFARLTEGLNIGTLSFEESVLTDSHVTFVHKAIQDHKVHRLDLSLITNSVSNTKKALLEFSTHVQSIRLNQRGVWDLDPAASHMFGVRDSDWPAIVLAMFAESRKLDKLILDNHPYSDFLSAESENVLRKELPKLPKKVWLESRRKHRPEEKLIKVMENGYRVRTLRNACEMKHLEWEPYQYRRAK